MINVAEKWKETVNRPSILVCCPDERVHRVFRTFIPLWRFEGSPVFSYFTTSTTDLSSILEKKPKIGVVLFLFDIDVQPIDVEEILKLRMDQRFRCVRFLGSSNALRLGNCFKDKDDLCLDPFVFDEFVDVNFYLRKDSDIPQTSFDELNLELVLYRELREYYRVSELQSHSVGDVASETNRINGNDIVDILSNSHVLVVDDEDPFHQIPTLLLREYGTKITSAYSGNEAIEVLNSNTHFDLVITDIVMEKDDSGFQVIQHIRETQQDEWLRTVIRTGGNVLYPSSRNISELQVDDVRYHSDLTAQKFFFFVANNCRQSNVINRVLEEKQE